jgi:hypothetical protein
MSASETMYDILAATVSGDTFWLLAVSGEHNAIKVMDRLAAKCPGSYFVLDNIGGSIVAKANTLDERLTA